MSSHRLGIDIAESTLSAALLNESLRVEMSTVVPRTTSTTAGLEDLLDQVLADVDPSQLAYVAFVTTAGREALERQDLAGVGALRISAPASVSVSPMSTWPPELAGIVAREVSIVRGGHDYNGLPLADLDTEAVRVFAEKCRDSAETIAITGLSSTVNPEHELRAAGIVQAVLGRGTPMTLAHETGGIGLLERENATILNAALIRSFARALRARNDMLSRRDSTSQIYVAQNDGTLLSEGEAARRPILTIESTISHAMRGAAHLCGELNAVVAYAQPEAITFGTLIDGYPQESSLPTDIASIRTRNRMPDLITVALPEPLDPARPILSARDRQRCAVAVRRMAGTHHDLPLIAAGRIAEALKQLPDDPAHQLIVVDHAGAVAAVGAAVADVSGSVDRTFDYERRSREESLASTVEAARMAAVRAGADIRHIRVDDIRETPLGYSPGRGARVRVRAVGPVLNPLST
ncbi:hydantoinase/oxoprolinase N-terminal domain-containing protein [Rhodococcus sp. NPDC059968]|uniref:hydantoinase/oxoprolinase N-terminal domain-containing protein n=1 Tax=Rhodococcus sp. NPDC059968 TaxID=3347017 RepID=UPI00366C2CCA